MYCGIYNTWRGKTYDNNITKARNGTILLKGSYTTWGIVISLKDKL